MANVSLRFQVNVYNLKIKNPKKTPLFKSYYFWEEVDDNMKFIDLIEKITKRYTKTKENPFYFEKQSELFWGQYFDDDIYCYMDYDINYNPEKFNISIKKLDKQFHISENIIEFNIDGPGIGGEVGRENGIHFFFHTNEKDIHVGTPHIHVKKGGIEYRVNLKSKEVMSNDKVFKNKKDNKIVEEFVDKFQEQLLDYWNRVVINGESLKLKLTL